VVEKERTMSGDTALPAEIKVALVEDDQRFREGLGLLVGGTPGFRLVGAFGSVEEALSRRPSEPPDVVLLDIHLPGMHGSEGVQPLSEHWPGAQILILTVFEEEDQVFTALCNGAVGYLLKRTPPGRLLDAVREAHGGGSPMSPEIARKVLHLFRRVPVPERVEATLSPQETRLLALIAEGASYQSAGDRLFISINTVRRHIRSIYEKLQVHTRSEAVSKAMRAGLI
jgi:DNA-binding NarL/FixJ family response regulator